MRRISILSPANSPRADILAKVREGSVGGKKWAAQRAFTVIETLAVVTVIVILAAIVIPRVVVLRQESTQQRNNFNARQIANAVERVQMEGGSLTNISSFESVVNQLVNRQVLYPSQKLTARQISMISTNGYLFFYGTYDD